MSSIDALAVALRRADPRLTTAASRHLAAELIDLVGRGFEEGWDFLRIELRARGQQGTELGDELKQLRRKTGLTQAQVAQRFHWSSAKVMRIEIGQVSVSTGDIELLINLYGAQGRAAQDLRDAALASRRRTRS